MKLIYMQQTIDYMARLDPMLLDGLGMYGPPEPVELMDDKGNTINKYFLFDLSDKIVVE